MFEINDDDDEDDDDDDVNDDDDGGGGDITREGELIQFVKLGVTVITSHNRVAGGTVFHTDLVV